MKYFEKKKATKKFFQYIYGGNIIAINLSKYFK